MLKLFLFDEGIKDYRAKTITDSEKFCKEHGIKLIKKSYKELFGKELDTFLSGKKIKPCSLCGALRRHSLNKFSRGFDPGRYRRS